MVYAQVLCHRKNSKVEVFLLFSKGNGKLLCHLNFEIVPNLLPLVLCALEEDDPSLTQRKSWQDVAVTLAAARGAWGPLIYTALKT